MKRLRPLKINSFVQHHPGSEWKSWVIPALVNAKSMLFAQSYGSK